MSDNSTSTSKRRLQQIAGTLANERHVTDLPDGARVNVYGPDSDGTSRILIDARPVLAFRSLSREAALILSGLGTSFEKSNVVPRYPVLELELIPVSDAITNVESNSDLWGAIYGLWTLFHVQEVIPVVFKESNRTSIDYLMTSGLARRALDSAEDALFLVRGTFWQGAGTGPAWGISRGWLRHALDHTPFPLTQTFTRTSLVIAQHPLRPLKPLPGAQVYARFCTPIGKMLRFHAIDPESKSDMSAFHRWMNDPRVNAGWGEQGDEEKHRRYVENVCAEPSVLPLIMSWDDEPMGYAEIVWIKENHVAPYVPGAGAQDYDRGLHVLVGESKFRGQDFSQAWFRSVTHYIFLSDSRTMRIVGEPKRINAAIIKTSIDAGMHLETKSFYFPYKHSVMTMNLRERLFKEDMFL